MKYTVAIALLMFVFCSSLMAQPVIKELWNPVVRSPGIAPGSIFMIKGSGFSADTLIAAAPPLPRKLGGVQVFVDRVECPLLFVSPDTIQAQLPFGITTERSSFAIDIMVRNAAGESMMTWSLGKTEPVLLTESRDGQGRAIVLKEDLTPNQSPQPGDIIIFQTTGLGDTDPPATAGLAASAAEPFPRVKELVEVFVGDVQAEVLFAGLSPGLTGIYQVKIKMPDGGGTSVRLRTEGLREVSAKLPGGDSAAMVTDVSGDIEPIGVPANPAMFSPILIAAKMTAAMTIGPLAEPFDVVLENEAASVKIRVKPADGTYEGTATVPTQASRNFDFSGAGFEVFDYAAGLPMPGNRVPASRIPPEYQVALRAVSMPNVPPPQGGVNAGVQFRGAVPSDGRLVLNSTMVPSGLTTAAWLPLAKDAPATYQTTLRLLVAGQEVARKDVTIPVHR